MRTLLDQDPIVDPEIRDLIPPIQQEERDLLRESLAEEGCVDLVTVWRGILLDGHNRVELCRELRIPFQVRSIELPSRDAARMWVLRHQLGRRNLKPLVAKELLGRLYNARKLESRKNLTPGSSSSIRQSGGSRTRTAHEVAAETGATARSVERAGKFAQDLQTIEATAGPEARRAILSGDVRLNSAQVAAIANLGPRDIEQMKLLAEQQRAERAVRRPTTGDQPFITREVLSKETAFCTDTGDEIVVAWVLSCRHRVPTKRRVLATTRTKSVSCPECGSGTRTPAERRKTERELRDAFHAALAVEHGREALFRLVQAALRVPGLRPGDVRAETAVREEIARCAQMAGLVGGGA
jgi:hypothetical protein